MPGASGATVGSPPLFGLSGLSLVLRGERTESTRRTKPGLAGGAGSAEAGIRATGFAGQCAGGFGQPGGYEGAGRTAPALGVGQHRQTTSA